MSHDTDLQLSVLAALNWAPNLVAAHIGVTAQAGVITLSGHVDNFVQKHAAENATHHVKGVRAIANEIEVQLAFDHQRTDDEIAVAALDRLAWDVSVPRNAVKIDVEKGWLTLTGTVDWHFQTEAAEGALRTLAGVTGISNHITIKSTVDTTNIVDNIMHALQRSWFFDPHTVQVSADSGEIHLTGEVHSWHDRQIAARTAWAAPGVTNVLNDITVH